jgi:hypothetical protein
MTSNDRLIPGKRYYAVQKTGTEIAMTRPMMIRVHFEIRTEMIPVLPAETLDSVLLEIELPLGVRGNGNCMTRGPQRSHARCRPWTTIGQAMTHDNSTQEVADLIRVA